MAERVFTKTILPAKLHEELLASAAGSIFDGVIYSGDDTKVTVLLSQEPNLTEDTAITDIINAHVATPTLHSTLVDYLGKDVYGFVKQLTLDFAAENIELGITQLGKTKKVADELQQMYYYLSVFSLYEAIQEIERLKVVGFDPADAPFLTDARMDTFKAKIEAFLGI